jgi:hypothetical protein
VPHLLDIPAIGERLDNGTWTDGLGMLHSGIVNIWLTSVFVTVERSNDFIYPIAFSIEKYGALMQRPTDTTFSIDVNNLLAGVDGYIYGIIFAILMLLFITAWMNEIVQYSNERNSNWHLLLSIFPANGQMWPHQTGVTRKVLMSTCGFTILVLSSLYQAKQAEQLMIPYPPPIFTLKDIENAVLYGNSTLVIDDSPIQDYVLNVSTILAQSIIAAADNGTDDTPVLMKINQYNGIYISSESSLVNALTRIEPELCKHYTYITFDEWGRTLSSLIMSKKRADLSESMNVIVAERMSYVDDYIQTLQLSEECRRHIFPVYTSNPKYLPLKLVKISGALTLLLLLLCLSVLVLLLEMCCYHRRPEVNIDTDIPPFDINLHIDDMLTLKTRRIIVAKYMEIMQAIDDDS